MMASGDLHKIIILLFHRPSLPPNPSKPSHLTQDVVLASQHALNAAITDHFSDTSTPAYLRLDIVSSLDNSSSPHIVRLSYECPIPIASLRNHPHLQQFEQEYEVDLCIIPTRVYSTPLKLAVFDMDSTLIQQEVIDLLASYAGVEAEVSSITSRAMNGELDFSASLRERVRLLRGLDESVFETLKERVTLSPGADTLLRVLKKKGVKTALLSGGFVPLARWVGGRLGIDHVHANELAVDGEGKLTGELKEGCVIVDGARKRQLLRQIADQEGLGSMSEVLAVGDGANDLPMLCEAGLGVAVNAKERVQKEAPCRLNGGMALLDVLYLAGLTGEEIDELAGS